MKFWNKDKDVRARKWIQVDVDFVYITAATEAKRWCQMQPSLGKFYFYYCDIWYFEREEDAVLFALKWA